MLVLIYIYDGIGEDEGISFITEDIVCMARSKKYLQEKYPELLI